MSLPIQINFFKKLELYQELKSLDKQWGKAKAWSGEKAILKWTTKGHHHLGTPINARFVTDNIWTDPRYENVLADANVSLGNLIGRGYASGETDRLLFEKEGLLMGEVINDVAQGKGWHYFTLYSLTWTTAILGATIAIVTGVNLVTEVVVKWIKLW